MTNFTQDQLFVIWQKGTPIAGYSPTEWRRDYIGNPMSWFKYGQMNNIYGWNVDHIVPQSMDGSDDISNLRPLNCYTNSVRQDGRF